MSSPLFNTLFAWKCSSTHHKLALDALNHIRGDAAENWRNLCLKNIETYLAGSKAPDDKFKDFKNHVLHVRDNYWGGAITATQKWYDATVVALREKRWVDAVYAAGVLSHYCTDPVQPYHTGQCEAEGIVHRAAEWSIACGYRELTDILEADLGGWPDVNVPDGPDWLAKMVKEGADVANPHYEACIQHYDLKKGVKDPPTGLDQEMKDAIAKLIGHAVIEYARIIERAFIDSNASPPATSITLLGVLSQLTIPILWVTKKIKDARERAIVEATYKEFLATGKVIDTLTEDDATIRAIHAEEVLKKPLDELDAEKPTPLGTAHGTGAPARPRPARKPVTTGSKTPATIAEALKPQTLGIEQPIEAPKTVTTDAANVTPPNKEMLQSESPKTASLKPTLLASQEGVSTPAPASPVAAKLQTSADRFYLDSSMPVERAPSIGPMTSAMLDRHGVKTVNDLLKADPEQLAKALNQRQFDAFTIRTWRTQAELCCTVPNLRGHDAQILVACGINRREELGGVRAEVLLGRVDAFVNTPAGERVLRGSEPPDLNEVTDWIAWANRPLRGKAA